MPIAATTWGTGQVLLDILWFFLFFIEIWLMVTIFGDLFSRHDMKGWQKALWVLLIIILPLLGILIYLIVYGDQMRAHALKESREEERELRDYVRGAAGSTSPADELARLADLKERGVIDDDEFRKLKERIVQGAGV